MNICCVLECEWNEEKFREAGQEYKIISLVEEMV